MDALCSYTWPGNIRELRNIVERAVLLCPQGEITYEQLVLPCVPEMTDQKLLTLSEMEHAHIRNILRTTGGNITTAARILGLARSTLNAKIKQLQSQLTGFRSACPDFDRSSISVSPSFNAQSSFNPLLLKNKITSLPWICVSGTALARAWSVYSGGKYEEDFDCR